VTFDVIRLCILLVCLFGVWLFATPKKMAALPANELFFFYKKKSLRRFLFTLNPFLFWLAAVFLAVALSNPRGLPQGILFAKKEPPREGIGIYFLLDRSGSMNETVTSSFGTIRKIDLAKKAIEGFVEKRTEDLIGLIAFSRIADVICPLTLDRALFLSRLSLLEPVTEDRLNGTAIGYAIFKTVNIIDATKYYAKQHKSDEMAVYTIKNEVIIIVTDGLQSPHPDDRGNRLRSMPLDEAFAYAKTHKTRIYFIGVDPIFTRPEFASDVKEMREEIAATGGAFFLANEVLPIVDVLKKINTLEKSVIMPGSSPVPVGYSLMPFFVACALCTLFIAIALETMVIRTIP
jgi:Ca-activated chloride channel family protein